MMLPAELATILTSSNPNDVALGKLPVLPVLAAPEESGGDGPAVFHFSPRRMRFHKDHEFFEDGDIHRHLYLQNVLTSVSEVVERPKVSEFCCHVDDCSQFFDTLEGYEHHYNTLHRNVCSFCKRSFPSERFLDAHILEWHDSLFQVMSEKQNMYKCLVEGCTEKFKTSRDRKEHLIKVHLNNTLLKHNVKMYMDTNVEDDTQLSPVDSMELSVPEPMESASSVSQISSSSESPHHKYRIPSTVCFGHNAMRGFKSTKEKE